MCLQLIKWERNHPQETKREIKTGWKVFYKHDGKLYPYISWLRKMNKPYKINEWIRDGSKGDVNEDCFFFKKYPKGFHVFKTRKVAREWKKADLQIYDSKAVIRKVEYSHVVAEGEQHNYSFSNGRWHEVDVARKMKILPDKI